jgi:hypothetical protein
MRYESVILRFIFLCLTEVEQRKAKGEGEQHGAV